MELKVEFYVIALLIISFGFFFIIAPKTDDAYRDILLTIAVVHFVMSKLITIKAKKRNLANCAIGCIPSKKGIGASLSKYR